MDVHLARARPTRYELTNHLPFRQDIQRFSPREGCTGGYAEMEKGFDGTQGGRLVELEQFLAGGVGNLERCWACWGRLTARWMGEYTVNRGLCFSETMGDSFFNMACPAGLLDMASGKTVDDSLFRPAIIAGDTGGSKEGLISPLNGLFEICSNQIRGG